MRSMMKQQMNGILSEAFLLDLEELKPFLLSMVSHMPWSVQITSG